MRLQNIVKILSVGAIALVMAGCGGGGGDGGSSTPPPPTSVPGGTASAPSVMSLELDNEISSNTFNNYFQYTGIEGEKLIFHATLDSALTARYRTTCQFSSSTFIAVYDTGLTLLDEFRTCGTDLTVELPVDGTYIFQATYPSSGYFNVASILP